MVLVLHHMLVSAFLYLANKLRFLTESGPLEGRTRGVQFTRHVQDALTVLYSAPNLVSFTKFAESFLRCLLPEAADVLIFILNPETDELEALAQDAIHVIKLPQSGISRTILEDKKKVQVDSLANDDPLTVLVPSAAISETPCRKVSLVPLLDREGQFVGILMVVCPFFEDLLAILDFAERQILNSLDQLLDRRKEQYLFRRQKTFLEIFGKSIETGVGPFSKKLGSFVMSQVSAEAAIILIVDQTSGELYNKYESDDIHQEKRIEVPGSIFEEPIQSRSVLHLNDITQNTKQRHDLVRITEHYVQSILCVPVVSLKTNDVIAMVCAFNKNLPSNRFSKADEENLKFCCCNIAALLENTLEWEKEMVIKKQQELLLKVAKNLFTHVDDVSVLLNEIMTEARNLTNAERCSLFLLDREQNELVAKVFDGEIPGKGNDKECWDLTIPANQGIVGQVAMTGKLLNIKDAYSHPLFYRGFDEKTGFRTRNILCFPIKGEEGVIGVAELCNKASGKCFTKFDEDLTRAFAIYCGISIVHSMLYKRAASAWHRSQMTSELMIYHMKVPQDEVRRLLSMNISDPEQFGTNFDSFSFTPRTVPIDKTVLGVLYMFDDLGMIERWKIPREILIRFTLMVKRGYRDPPYHNWVHAFTVAHFCYLLLKNTDLQKKLKDIERLALFVSCLCHDLDHRGTNNAFQVTSNSNLAALYSSEGSVMERHHLAQTVCILNTSGCNIFKNLSEAEFEKILDLVRNIILATDLSHHLGILQDLKRMAQDGYRADRVDHRNLLLCLMMTSSDLSDQTKPFEGTRKIADLIYTEFFGQGDLEKVMGFTPMEMMDRERACIPKLQIDFLESIALPVYSVLHDTIPETAAVLEEVKSNRDHWKAIQEQERLRANVNGIPDD